MNKSFVLGICTLFLACLLGFLNPTMADAKMTIPEDALLYNGHYYYYYTEKIGWPEAEEACEALGGHLVTFSNQDEENAIWELIGNDDAVAWIGMYNTKEPDRIYMKIDHEQSDFAWVTGEKIKYSNWALSQPSGTFNFALNMRGVEDFEKYVVIANGVKASGFEEGSNTPSWGDRNSILAVEGEEITGYVCEWDIYEIEVENAPKKLKKGKSVTLKYTIYDAAGHVKVKSGTAKFKTSKKSVATVNKNGKVTAKKKGSCTITLTYKNCSKKVKIKVVN